jgi:hypothetical protein
MNSNYDFLPNEDDLADEPWRAYHRSLEISFETHTIAKTALVFSERGWRITACCNLLEEMLTAVPEQTELIQVSWIEPLIQAAKQSGAKHSERL